MSRSLKKGPFIETKLLKRIEAMNQKNEKKVVLKNKVLLTHQLSFCKYYHSLVEVDQLEQLSN